MACTLQTNSDYWLAVFGADPALRQCVADVFGIIDVEITADIIGEAEAFVGVLNDYLGTLQLQLDVLLPQVACVNLIVNRLSALVNPPPEALALLADMTARGVLLNEQQLELEASLSPAQIPSQVILAVATVAEMECQKANAQFFKTVTGGV